MELAMHRRDSDNRFCVFEAYGSEWTVVLSHALLVVAFPGDVRQLVLDLGDTSRRKVAGLRFCVIACGVLARI